MASKEMRGRDCTWPFVTAFGVLAATFGLLYFLGLLR